MKKILSIVVAMTLAATLFAGCNQGKPASSKASSSSAISSSSDVSSSDVSSSESSSSEASSSANSSSSGSASTAAQTAAVTSNVTAGTYTTSRYVTLKATTAGSTIYYTTDGSMPTAKSNKYSSPITISKTTTLKAIAVASGYTTSAVASFAYTIATPTSLPGDITTDGSTALQPLLTAITPLFEKKYSSAFTGNIAIGGGGSGTGINDVEAGYVKIGDSDVSLKQKGGAAAGYTDLVDHTVCIVGVAIVVNPDVAAAFNGNPIKMSDVQQIFAGKITNWKDVAGSNGLNEQIVVTYRGNGSGTRVLFETFGNIQKDTTMETLDSTSNSHNAANPWQFISESSSSSLKSYVNGQKGAIGYETLPYVSGMTKIAVDFGSGAIPCDYAHIDNGSYPLWGYEHLFTKGQPNATIQAFIDFITSPESQSTIVNNGYGLSANVTSASAIAAHK